VRLFTRTAAQRLNLDDTFTPNAISNLILSLFLTIHRIRPRPPPHPPCTAAGPPKEGEEREV